MQFVIMAYDSKEEGTYEKRMSVRPKHLESVGKIKDTGKVISAGGMTDSEGKLIGSVLIVDFPSRKELDDYLAQEPYIVNNVWSDIKIESFNTVILNNEKYSC